MAREHKRGEHIGCGVLTLAFGGLAAVLALSAVVLFSVLATGCDDLELNLGSGRPDVAAIPLPPSSCPYLREVRDRADAAARVWYDEFATQHRVVWPPFAYKL